MTDPVPSFRVELAAMVHRRSWDWFLELRQRLNIAAEIVDDRSMLLLPADTKKPAATLRQLLTAPGYPTSSAALAHAIQSKTPATLSIEGLQIASFPLSVGHSATGALVLAGERDMPAAASLDAIGSWLSHATEAHLASIGEESDDVLRSIVSVRRLLDQAATGSEQDVVRAFAEAMAVWEELEVRGYVETVQGRFALSVDLPGSDRGEAPAVIDGDEVAGDRMLVCLSTSDADRLGFRATDVCLTRFGGDGDVPWLVAMSGELKYNAESRLAVYVDLLGQALRTSVATSAARTNQMLLQHLLIPDDQIETPVGAALDQLTRILGASGSALMVTMSNGMHVLSVGDDETFCAGGASQGSHQIASTARLLDRYRMVLAVRRGSDRPFTRRDQQIVDSAAALFSAWLPGVLRRVPAGQDRRQKPKTFDEIIDRLVTRATLDDTDVTVLVVRLGQTVLHPLQLQRVVADIRALLRPSDVAGLLSDSEIGVVLADTAATHSDSVVKRLRQHWDAAPYGAALATASIGIAGGQAGEAGIRSVARAARDDAASRA